MLETKILDSLEVFTNCEIMGVLYFSVINPNNLLDTSTLIQIFRLFLLHHGSLGLVEDR
jgi:hypothetical protein